MPKKPVDIDHLHFESKKAAIAHFKQIKNSTPDHEELTGQDRIDVEALLYRHENAEEKIGSGILELYVQFEEEKGSRCFHVYRTDNTRVHFSYHNAIGGEVTPRLRFMCAARNAIEDDKQRFKSEYFRKHADSKGLVRLEGSDELWSRMYAHVHHEPPLREIADDFMTEHNLQPENVEYTTTDVVGTRFKDEALIERFREYHNQRAKLIMMPYPDHVKLSYQARADQAPQTV